MLLNTCLRCQVQWRMDYDPPACLDSDHVYLLSEVDDNDYLRCPICGRYYDNGISCFQHGASPKSIQRLTRMMNEGLAFGDDCEGYPPDPLQEEEWIIRNAQAFKIITEKIYNACIPIFNDLAKVMAQAAESLAPLLSAIDDQLDPPREQRALIKRIKMLDKSKTVRRSDWLNRRVQHRG